MSLVICSHMVLRGRIFLGDYFNGDLLLQHLCTSLGICSPLDENVPCRWDITMNLRERPEALSFPVEGIGKFAIAIHQLTGGGLHSG